MSAGIGIGKVYGTILDRLSAKPVPLRTPPAWVARYGRGYAVSPAGIRAVPAGTQYGAWRAEAGVTHLGEDLYVAPGVPVYAPFAGRVEAIYPSGGGDYGEVIVLRSREEPRLKLRIIHMRAVAVRAGQTVSEGDRLATTYTPAKFPKGDPSHIHLEAIVTDAPNGGAPGDKGNVQPLSVLDASRLVERSDAGSMLGAGIAAALAASLGWLAWRQIKGEVRHAR